MGSAARGPSLPQAPGAVLLAHRWPGGRAGLCLPGVYMSVKVSDHLLLKSVTRAPLFLKNKPETKK